MNASIPQLPRRLPVGFSAAAWLVVFLSPSAYVLLLLFWNRWQIPAPPDGLVFALFVLVPFLATRVLGGGVGSGPVAGSGGRMA